MIWLREERIRDHFPDEKIVDGRRGRKPIPNVVCSCCAPKLIHPIRPVGHQADGLDLIVVQVPTRSQSATKSLCANRIAFKATHPTFAQPATV
jgi:hypothetical protein